MIGVLRDATIKYRQIRQDIDENGLMALGKEMAEKRQNALSIDVGRIKGNDFSFLQWFSHLDYLSIGGTPKCFNGLQYLPKLKDLCLLRMRVNSLEFLEYCMQIEKLDIRRTK